MVLKSDGAQRSLQSRGQAAPHCARSMLQSLNTRCILTTSLLLALPLHVPPHLRKRRRVLLSVLCTQILPWLSCPFRAVPQHSPHLLERTPSPHVPHRLEIAGGFFVSEAMRATCRLDIDAQHALERVALVCAGGKLFSFCHGTSSTQQPTAPIPALVHAAAARRPTLPRR